MTPFCQGTEWSPRRTLREPGTCGACGTALRGRNHWFCRGSDYTEGSCASRYAANHLWGYARPAAIKRDQLRCVRCGNRRAVLEVNHIVPRRGQGYGKGCHHHQTNLETLCRPCHVAVGVEQRERDGEKAGLG